MKKREERHRVLIQARMRGDDGWSDVLIQNVSAHGMMMRTAKPPSPGSYIEVRKAAMVVVARAVWARDQFFGVRAQDRIELEELFDQANQQMSAAMGLTGAKGDRRKQARTESAAEKAERSRRFATLFQFGMLALAAGIAALMIAQGVVAVLHAPVAAVEAALDGTG